LAEYTKKWLSVDDQVARLVSRGITEPGEGRGAQLLYEVGYYRLTGYLYPFRKSERYLDDTGRERVRVLSGFRQGTSLKDAAALIDFDRRLRLLVLEAIERIEISLRMQIGYVLGHRSAFAHLETSSFVSAFTESSTDAETGQPYLSKHELWVARLLERQNASDEAFVYHFREKYDGRLPIWAATEIMELGHLNRLYGGLNSSIASEIAAAYGVPSKRIMGSWIASLNYVRNVAAHHARLFNRKLVTSPKRPPKGDVPLLDHLRDQTSSKEVLGLYNALAVMAYMLRAIGADDGWAQNLVKLLETFPESSIVTLDSLGVPGGWTGLELWRGPG